MYNYRQILNKKTFLLTVIFAVAFTTSFFYNEINLHYLKQDKCSLRSDETIITADDESYLVPPSNYLKNNIWKDNSLSNDTRSYFLRPPGYGVFYMIHVYLFGETNALKIFKITQLLLFALSVVLLFQICARFINNKIIVLTITALYGFTPFTIGFLYYTLTEGITPALVIFYIYFLTEATYNPHNLKKQIHYFLAAIILSVIIITRPVLAIMGIFFIIFLLHDFKKNILAFAKYTIVYSFISFSLFTIWSIRNYHIAGEFPGLHPIYYNESNSVYRKTHQAIWEFYKCWGIKNENFHALIAPIWDTGIKGDTSVQHLDLPLKNIPDEAKKIIPVSDIIKAFKLYQGSILHQKIFLGQGKAMPKGLSILELKTIKEFNRLTEKYSRNFFFTYHFIVPVKNFIRLSAHSNLSLYLFQKQWRGSIIMEFFRICFFMLHICLMSIIFLTIFIFRKELIKFVFPLATIFYIFFLCYIYREWEERYTLPIIPICLINLGLIIDTINQKIRIYKQKSMN